jgi:hypothetical protein
MHKTLLAFTVASLLITAPAQAPAQEVMFDPSELLAACQIDCASHVANLVAELRAQGLDQAQINEQIGLIAAVIVEASAGAPPEVRQLYAEGLLVAANNSTDPVQAENIQTAAAQVAAGEDVTDIDVGVGASPA